MKNFILFVLVGASIQINTPLVNYSSNDSGKEAVIQVGLPPERVPAAEKVEENKPIPHKPQDYWQQPSSAQEYWGR